ncbi:MAG TPA: hypothetical protein PLA94_21545, partial [Myxococcota bacterium]|nr:hypothetical protein [Myxococcota bacterium]
MLRAVEQLLMSALAPLEREGVVLRAGPQARPAAAAVGVRGLRLTVGRPDEDHSELRRGPARLRSLHRATRTNTRTWTLPWAEGQRVEEVGIPGGAPLRAGDDYVLAEVLRNGERLLEIQLYYGLQTDALRVVVVGGPAEGYEERQRCKAE